MGKTGQRPEIQRKSGDSGGARRVVSEAAELQRESGKRPVIYAKRNRGIRSTYKESISPGAGENPHSRMATAVRHDKENEVEAERIIPSNRGTRYS